MSLRYLLDLATLAELTRPNGNRRVFTLFQQRQARCALGAPVLYALLRGIDGLTPGSRQQQLRAFAAELLRSGPTVLPFDGDAALWLVRETGRREQRARPWSSLDGRIAAIAATRQLVLVTGKPTSFAGSDDLLVEDWFRP